ncbi:MAG: hypothetical protein U5O39_10400 [Gammaproteobacteria bacterium]|nr:hypothetical protein [Gammaproteobacteria bacterium]
MNRIKQLLWLSAMTMLLTGCGGGGSSSPPPTAGPEPDEEPVTTTVEGVAAIGAALDGATVEVIDANGSAVDIPDTLTGADGSYQIDLPEDTALPIIVRVTPPDGEPLLTVVQDLGDASTGITANINPITDLTAQTALGGVDESSNSDLGGALGMLDPTTLDETGEQIVQNVLGANVSYDTYANDPDFIANDGTNPGSAADAALDTLARRADDAGTTTKDALALFAEAEQPPRLMEDPTFQVEIVSEMVKGGTDTADLESELDNIGALLEVDETETDVFRIAIDVIPTIVENARASAGEVTDNPDLINAAVDSAVNLVTNSIRQKKERFKATDDDLGDMLNSSGFQNTVSKVVSETVVPVIATAAAEEDASELADTVRQVGRKIAEEASSVASGIDYANPDNDASDVVTAFVRERVRTGQDITADTLRSVRNGEADTTDLVGDTGDVAQAQRDVAGFVQENPDLDDDGDISDVIEEIPTGSWDRVRLGRFQLGLEVRQQRWMLGRRLKSGLYRDLCG